MGGGVLIRNQNRFHKAASEGTLLPTICHGRPEMVNPNVNKHHHSLDIFIEQEQKKVYGRDR